MKRHKITELTLKEFSAVRRPAQAGATIDLTKSDTRLVLIEKAAPTPPEPPGKPTGDSYPCAECKTAKVTTEGSKCAACAMQKSGDPTPSLTEKQMNELETAKANLTKALADGEGLKAQLAKSEKFGLLTDIEKAHYNRLGGDAQRAFLDMAPSARAEETKPVYTSEFNGQVFTKADDTKLVEMAKGFDVQRKEFMTQIEKAKEAAIEGRVAAELGHLPGTTQERGALLKAVEGIADEKLRAGAMTALKAADAQRAGNFQRQGGGQTAIVKSGSAEDQLNQKVEAYAKAEKVPMSKAWDAVLATDEGGQLYGQMEAEKQAAGRDAKPN